MSKVLVIGGGLGGAVAIKGIRKHSADCQITLVEPKEYCEIAWAAYRAPFDDKTRKASLCPLEPFCRRKNVQHIRTTVKQITSDCNKAELSNGDTIDFDVCVVATGATTKWPVLGRGPDVVADGSIESRKKQSKEAGEAILNAGSVLIVGGGLIGTELAGDIAGFAKKAKKPMQVTLVHSGSHLCPEVSEKAASMIQKQLEQKGGVKVILNECATQEDDGVWKLKSGETLEAAMVIQTVGLVACNDILNPNFSSSLNESGFCDSDKYFRVKNTNGRIFSIGDCCTTLPNAGAQLLLNIDVIGHNVRTKLKSVEANVEYDDFCYKKHILGPKIHVVTTGPKSGVMHSSSFSTRFFLPWLKNKTMFFFRVKSTLGLKPTS